MISRAGISGVVQGQPKYRSMLAGNSAYLPTSYESIASVTPSGTNTVTFSSIPSNFTTLQIRASFGDAAENSLQMRFNGDTGSNYQSSSLEGNGTTVTGNAGYSETTMSIAFRGQGASTSASFLAGAIIDIPKYSTSGTYKTCLSSFGVNQNTTGKMGFTTGVWFNTSVITSITITMAANYSSGTVFSLYGIRG
jgi:hypothetical protein